MINITKEFHFEIAILSVKRKFCTNNSITVTPTRKTDLYIVQTVILGPSQLQKLPFQLRL